MTPRYLITGGAGFIGSHIAQALLDRGETIRILDNLSTLAASAASRGSALSTTTSSTSAIASNSSMISTQAPVSPIRPAGGTISAKRQGAPGSDFSIAIDPS